MRLFSIGESDHSSNNFEFVIKSHIPQFHIPTTLGTSHCLVTFWFSGTSGNLIDGRKICKSKTLAPQGCAQRGFCVTYFHNEAQHGLALVLFPVAIHLLVKTNYQEPPIQCPQILVCVQFTFLCMLYCCEKYAKSCSKFLLYSQNPTNQVTL